MKTSFRSAMLGVALLVAMTGTAGARPLQCYETCDILFPCSDECYHGGTPTTCGEDGQICRDMFPFAATDEEVIASYLEELDEEAASETDAIVDKDGGWGARFWFW